RKRHADIARRSVLLRHSTRERDREGVDAGAMRSGSTFTADESRQIVRYCMDDVRATVRLYEKLKPANAADEWRAIHRGHYTAALASVVHRSTPIDIPVFEQLKACWPTIASRLTKQFSITREVYSDGSFSHERFAHALRKRGIKSWPP